MIEILRFSLDRAAVEPAEYLASAMRDAGPYAISDAKRSVHSANRTLPPTDSRSTKATRLFDEHARFTEEELRRYVETRR